MLKFIEINDHMLFTSKVVDEKNNILFYISINENGQLLLWGNDELGREPYSKVLRTNEEFHNFINSLNEFAKEVGATEMVIANDYDYYCAAKDTQSWAREGFKHKVGLANHILIRDVQ